MKKYKKRGGKSKMPSRAEFEFMYYELNLPAKEMAERYNVKPTTIYNWATKYRNEEA